MRSLLLGLILVLAVAFPASAAQRVALVIGNSDYELISPLANPENDAALMAETLREVGFEVIEAKNADRRGMARAIRDFGKRLRGAGSDAVGLFYYAGHGVQAGGANYLIPLGAQVETEADLEIEAVSAGWVLGQMEYAGNGLNMVILDACRNNPFKGSFRASTRGLARMDAPTGSLVAYAAGPGQVAADGAGANSPYTETLAKVMRRPGRGLLQMFNAVGVEVAALTRGKQQPWVSSSPLPGGFSFVPPKATAVPAPAAAPAQETPSADREVVFWNSIEDSEDRRDFDAYLAQFPEGTFAGLARVRRDRLNELMETAVAALPPAETPGFAIEDLDAAYIALRTANLRSGPGTEHGKVGLVQRDTLLQVTGRAKGKKWLRITYRGDQAFIFAPLAAEVDTAEAAAWENVKDSKNAEEISAFLEDYPDGRLLDTAGRQLAALKSGLPPEIRQRALSMFSKSYSTALEIKSPRGMVNNLASLAKSQWLAEDLKGATRSARTALKAYEQIDDPDITNAGGLVAMLPLAGLTDEARRLAQGLGKEWQRYSAYGNIAGGLALKGDIRAALQMANSIPDADDRMDAYGQIAAAQASNGQWDGALKTIDKISDAEKRDTALELTARGLANAGYLKPALRLMDRVSGDGSWTRMILADALIDVGQKKQAIDFLHSVEIAINSDLPQERGPQMLSFFAKVLVKAGEISWARRITKEFSDIVSSYTESRNEKFDQQYLAVAQAAIGEVKLALKTARNIEEEFNSTFALLGIATALAEAQHIDEALRIANTIPVDHTRHFAVALIVREVSDNGDIDRALKIASKIGEAESRGFAYRTIGDSLINSAK